MCRELEILVIATITAARATGASLVEACDLANHAAGVVVAKLGTATVTPEEIIEHMDMKGCSKCKKALFLDRDGTLIKDKHYLHDPDEVELFEGVKEALDIAKQNGFLLCIPIKAE